MEDSSVEIKTHRREGDSKDEEQTNIITNEKIVSVKEDCYENWKDSGEEMSDMNGNE